MKNRAFSYLLVPAMLALPALAQQTGSTSGTQPGATATQSAPISQDVAGSREKLEPPSTTDFWEGEDPNLANLVAHPFASKKYVKRYVQPIQDRLNELDELTTSHAQMIKDVDTRASQGLQLVSSKEKEADQHAIDAGSKAETAKLAATQTSTRVANAEQLVGNIDEYKNTSQTEIQFFPGQKALSKQAKDTLDEMAAPLKDQHNYLIEVKGLAPGHGHAAAIAASRMMADSVVRYMVLEHKIPVYRIYVLALGDASVAQKDTAKTRDTNRGRVQINLLRNELLSSTQR